MKKLEFDNIFRDTINRINRERLKNPKIQNALNRYHGRSLVFRVKGDATYVFYITRDGVKYELNPAHIPDDMYVEMDISRARKLIYNKTLGIMDIPLIKYKNITLADIKIKKKLFGVK